MEHNGNAKGATLGGTLLCILCNLHPQDLLRTIILAALGATVSFAVSMAFKWGLNKWKRWVKQD